MALTETRPSDKKPEHKGPDKKEKLPTKVVIRRLPPQMDTKTFLNQISPVPSYDYFYMIKGDLNLGENAFSRAFINFTNPHDVFDFKEKFDNYVFVDSNTGHEYPAVVEFAAFQKIPKKRNKVRLDPKCGTMESDPIYKEFVEFIKNPPQPEEKPEYSLQLTSENKNNEVVSTPLLEFVKNKRAERLRIREERREERKRKEFERRKYQEDRKKNFEERSPIKYKNQYKTTTTNKENDLEKDNDKTGTGETAEEKPPPLPSSSEKFEKSVYFKNRDKKYDERKRDTRPKYSGKKEYVEKREFKNRRDDYKDYRPKYDDYKKVEGDSKTQKKVKKYSEKREERKIEAQKAEQKKLEQPQQQKEAIAKETVKSNNKEPTSPEAGKNQESANKTETTEENREKSKTPENETTQTQSTKRIRNKDRPTIAIYRPGMLSKRKQTEEESDGGKKE